MKIKFIYNEDKDIDCLLSKGGGSNNQLEKKTKTYEALLANTSDLGNREKVRGFVRGFIQDNKLDPQKSTLIIQKNWDSISGEFEKRSEKIFGLNIPDNIAAYLTIAGRFPYSIKDKYFYVSVKKNNANPTIMHELWHFYTWHKFGNYAEKIGSKIFNDTKEALTILLNIEYKDLLGGSIDTGYSQHEALRNLISNTWSKTERIDAVWQSVLNEVTKVQ